MEIINNDSPDQLLEKLFRETRLETPSSGFTEKMNIRIEKEIRKKEWKRKWAPVGQIAAGVFSMIASAVGILYWQSKFLFSILKTEISFFKNDISFDPLVWVIGLAVLLVLLSDSLIRKYTHS